MVRFHLIGGLACIGILAACVSEISMPEPSEGAALFAANCTVCHGVDATGGVTSAGRFAPDLTKLQAKNEGVFPRARALSQIDGYGRGEKTEGQMPEFGLLLKGDLVPIDVDGVLTPTPRALAALLAYLEDIQS